MIENVSTDINYLLGQAYHLVLEFEDASRHYKEHKEKLKGDELIAYMEVLIQKIMRNARMEGTISKEPVRVIIQNLGDEVNSKYDDYNPVFAYGDTALYYTSRRPFGKAKRNPVDNKFNEDIYRSRASGTGFRTSPEAG